MVMIGPKSSDSNCPRVAGVPSATNLKEKETGQRGVDLGGREGQINSPNQSRNRLESVLVELGVTGVLADLTDDADEVLEDDEEDGSEGLSSGKDDSHDTCARRKNDRTSDIKSQRGFRRGFQRLGEMGRKWKEEANEDSHRIK